MLKDLDKELLGDLLNKILILILLIHFNQVQTFMNKDLIKKKRFPSWSDRILWRRGATKTTNICDVKCLKYGISMDQTMSDHKPVYAHLQYKANKFNLEKRNEMKKQIMKNMDRNNNAKIPKIEIESEISFPAIKFGETQKKKFIIHNTGNVAVTFRFTHADHKESLPKWLKINPNRGLIRPQEKKTIIFEVCINAGIAGCVQSIPNNNHFQETALLKIEN
eukprot:139552_1